MRISACGSAEKFSLPRLTYSTHIGTGDQRELKETSAILAVAAPTALGVDDHARLFRPRRHHKLAKGGDRSFGNSLTHHQLLKAGIGERITLDVGEMCVEIFFDAQTAIVRHGTRSVEPNQKSEDWFTVA